MTFEQLLYVEVLSHYNSLQEAADVLHLSKSGLSLAICKLEEELGIKIFERTAKGTRVTQAVMPLLSSISGVLQSKAQLERQVSLLGNKMQKKTIRIRYINTMFKAFMNPFLNHYQEKYSCVFYDISRDSSKSIIQAVRNGEIDAGFIASSDIESEWIHDLIFQPVCYGKIVMGVSENSDLLDREVTLDNLKQQKFCLFDDVYHEILFERLQFLCGPLNLILKTDDYWAICEAVTRLNAVCIGRSQQGMLSRENASRDVMMVDIGHLINDNTVLGWLTNPRVEQSKLFLEMLEDITEETRQTVP